jgi:hypothetical protein
LRVIKLMRKLIIRRGGRKSPNSRITGSAGQIERETVMGGGPGSETKQKEGKMND